MIWHNADANSVLHEFNVDAEKGLPRGVAEQRLLEYGSNAINDTKPSTFWGCVLSQFKNVYVIILAVVAVLYGVLSLSDTMYGANWWDSVAILLVLIATALVGAFFEKKSQEVFSSLSEISMSTCEVVRDGVTMNIPAKDLVPGDIVLLKFGNYIPADGRIISANEFRCNESILTGDLVPAEKNPYAVLDSIAPINARCNMVFAGSSVIHGNAKVVVTDTGINTEIGRKSTILKDSGEEKSTITERIGVFARIFNIISLIICALFFVLSLLLTISELGFVTRFFENLLISLSLVVAALPESLLAINSVVIAMGVTRLISGNIVPKKIASLEKMGGISVICTDKTGILTTNNMVLSKIFMGEEVVEVAESLDEKSALLLKLALMCTESSNDELHPTNQIDEAVLNASIRLLNMNKKGCDNLYPPLISIPFDPERKLMTTVNMLDGNPVAVVKGAPEAVLKYCTGNYDAYLKAIDTFANESLHIICIAVKVLDEIPSILRPELLESDLKVVGLLAMTDNVQNDVLEYVKVGSAAGIKTVMFTGDHLSTAKAVAEGLEILKENELAITGEELRAMSDEELAEIIENCSVFARVNSVDKLRIIKAWQAKERTVAVTGTDVEDEAALQIADIGFAMGKTSTDVAQGACDVLVTDNHFSGIVRAILRSRGLFDNIKKCIHYLLACNLAELICVLLCVIIFKVPPLAAVHLLLINLITDFFPAIALGSQPTDLSTKQQAPKKRYAMVLDNTLSPLAISQSVILTIISVIAFGIGGSSLTFATLSLCQILVALNLSSDRSIIHLDFLRNKNLCITAAVCFVFVILTVVTPLSHAFALNSLRFVQVLLLLLFAALTLGVGELFKYLKPKFIKE